ncbi:MAG: glucose-1-phosphate adenylyltransferase [Firmicutes bacterium]|nr:glucose-1-phosphate adenylyltransferase [Bacillota bacterium]
MKEKEILAMLLAGGQGSRLGALTKTIAKPAVSFGGKYRIIDFSLSNCANSHIDTVGVLTQYRPYLLNSYIGTGSAWGLDASNGGVSILPPYATESGGEWYQGTADAIYRNLNYINLYDPKYVLILSGDHLYRMNYREMLKCHKENNADLTISVMKVPMEEASRFGIMTTDETGRIVKFSEKPKQPDSDLASMGIYIFNKDVLEKALIEDSTDSSSEHDFGKNIIPKLLAEGKRLFCYEFSGFWMDVGTISSFHETSMGLLEEEPEFDLDDRDFPIFSNENISPPHYIGPEAEIQESIVGNGSEILGKVIHSVISVDSYVGTGALVKDSVLLPGAAVEEGATVNRAILGENSVIRAGAVFGSEDPKEDIAVIGDDFIVEKGGEA